jgi:hypothetical protein
VVSVFHVPRRAGREQPEAVARRVFGVAKVRSLREGRGLRYGMVGFAFWGGDVVVVATEARIWSGLGDGDWLRKGMTFASTFSTIRT